MHAAPSANASAPTPAASPLRARSRRSAASAARRTGSRSGGVPGWPWLSSVIRASSGETFERRRSSSSSRVSVKLSKFDAQSSSRVAAPRLLSALALALHEALRSRRARHSRLPLAPPVPTPLATRARDRRYRSLRDVDHERPHDGEHDRNHHDGRGPAPVPCGRTPGREDPRRGRGIVDTVASIRAGGGSGGPLS